MNFMQAVITLASSGKDYCMRPVSKDEQTIKEYSLKIVDNELYFMHHNTPYSYYDHNFNKLEYDWEVIKRPREYISFSKALEAMIKHSTMSTHPSVFRKTSNTFEGFIEFRVHINDNGEYELLRKRYNTEDTEDWEVIDNVMSSILFSNTWYIE